MKSYIFQFFVVTIRYFTRSICCAVAALLCLSAETVRGHGGVVGEDDLCIINIGYLKAHFKIYVPQETGHDDYCEDIPIRGESIFIMEYQHESLNDALIDFRIIRNVTGKGTFARLRDVQAIDDLDAVTVRYEPPAVVPAVYMLLHDFEHDGEYIGIVSAANDTRYTAVFPFEVGHTGVGIWPWILGALVLLQLQFWYMARRRKPGAAVAGLAIALCLAPVASADTGPVDTWISNAGHFHVRVADRPEPVPANRMHEWILEIRAADGSPVDDAEVAVSGGMPEHNHGLPTAPRVSERLGDGRYRLAGLRFHMSGYWEIRLAISSPQHRDVVTIPLTLQ